MVRMEKTDQELELEYVKAKVGDEKVSRYLEIRNNADILYKSFRSIKCPALKNQEVYFNAEGFNHLIYRIPKQERDKRVQIMRFELLEKARELIGITTTLQEYEDYLTQIPRWMNKKKQMTNVKICDSGLVGIIKGYRIKVVLRKIGNGKIEFHSVIPAWSTRYYRDIKIIRNTKGNVAD